MADAINSYHQHDPVEVYTYDPPAEPTTTLHYESSDVTTLQATISRLMGEELRLTRELSEAKADIELLRELITAKDGVIASHTRTIASANNMFGHAAGRALMQVAEKETQIEH